VGDRGGAIEVGVAHSEGVAPPTLRVRLDAGGARWISIMVTSVPDALEVGQPRGNAVASIWDYEETRVVVAGGGARDISQ
jgi:hypothetical protein